jgi:hypothetical protein
MSEELSYLLAVFAAWRVTHLLAYEEGPFALIARARRASAQRIGSGVACFYCLSVWVPVPFAFLLADGLNGVLLWLGGSGVVVLLDKWFAGAPALHWEEETHEDELLQKNEAPYDIRVDVDQRR